MPAERLSLMKDEHAEDRRRDGDAREHQGDSPVEWMRSIPLAPQRGQQRSAHGGVRRRHDEERHGIQDDCAGCFGSLARRWYAARSRWHHPRRAAYKDGPLGLFPRADAGATVLALGDATSRCAHQPAISRGGAIT